VERVALLLHRVSLGVRGSAVQLGAPRAGGGIDQRVQRLAVALRELVDDEERDAGTPQRRDPAGLLVVAALAQLARERVARFDELVRRDVGERTARGPRALL
jgi:hypothetical protein